VQVVQVAEDQVQALLVKLILAVVVALGIITLLTVQVVLDLLLLDT
jgi:hypothetical protein